MENDIVQVLFLSSPFFRNHVSPTFCDFHFYVVSYVKKNQESDFEHLVSLDRQLALPACKKESS